MKIAEIHNLELEAVSLEDIDISVCIKNYVLFTQIDDKICIALCQKYLSICMDYLSKSDFKQEIVFLDEDSFDRLYNKFLEVRTDNALGDIEEEQEKISDDDDMSLSEFLKNSSDILTSEESAPIIKFVNSLFFQAVKKRASDIHIDMYENKGKVKFRIDGTLRLHVELDVHIMNLIISRLKVISNLDISEKRIPQDGRTQIKIAKETLDVRVSVLPTYYGERVVMRMLMHSDSIPKLYDLGFDEDVSEQLVKLSHKSYGIILVTGPTGSGKSTTLHSLLQEIEDPKKNIITVEDPVEYKSEHINQIQVNEKVGLTFESGLRSILRQDPDIVMVGEIRDPQTAKISIQASLTGHLVLSTLHTNTATAAITRLIDMDVEKFLLASSVLGVLAQRLVRILCPHCKQEDTSSLHKEHMHIPKGTILYKSSSCVKCEHTGYLGRIALGELFIVDDSIADVIKNDISDHELRKIATSKGMKTLQDKIMQMFIEGKTSWEEIVRIGLQTS